MTLKLDFTGIGWEMMGLRDVEVVEGGECTRQKEEYLQRPRGKKGTESRKIQLKISL